MAKGQTVDLIHNLRKAFLRQDIGRLTDGELLECFVSQGEEVAFEALLRRHGPMVWGVCRRVLLNRPDAEDAFQATFLVLVRKAASIVPRDLVGNWLYGVAQRTAQSARREAARRCRKEREVPPKPGPEDGVCQEWQPLLDQELSRLPDKYRAPVLLCDLEGKTRREAARQLGWPVGTVAGRLARARDLLAQRLARRGVALSTGSLALALAQSSAAVCVPRPLVATTARAVALFAARKTAAGAVSAQAASLAEGVLKMMHLAKFKMAAVMLLILAGVGLLLAIGTHHALGDKPKADKPAKDKDNKGGKKGEKNAPKPTDFAGRIVDVSQDGKRLTLELPRQQKGEEAKRVAVQLTDKTQITYHEVGPNEAKPTVGYGAQVWLQTGSMDQAVRVVLRGKEFLKKRPDIHQRVVAVASDGKGITVAIPGRKINKSETEEPKKVAIKFTPKSRLTFSNVGPGGAKLTADYDAHVWLVRGSKDTAALVALFGSQMAPRRKGEAPTPSDSAGRVVALASDGKNVTLQIPGKKKKGEAAEAPKKVSIKLTNKTQVSYHSVGLGGAQPAVGYQVQVWLEAGSPDTVARVAFHGDTREMRTRISGKVVAASMDGKTITVEIPGKKRKRQPEESARKIDIKTTGTTRIVYTSVGPGGAHPMPGYQIQVWLEEGSKDTADEVILARTGG